MPLRFVTVAIRKTVFGSLFLAALLLLPAAADALLVRAGLEQNPPLSFLDTTGQPAGLLIDLLNHVAAREGWTISYRPDTFDQCLEKLKSGEIDLMVTIAYSPARGEVFDFNRLDVVANWGVLYAPFGHTINSFFDLEGQRIAVMTGDTHHRALRQMLEKFNIPVDYLEVSNFDQVFRAIESGEAAAGVVGRFYALGREDFFRVQATPLIFNPIEVHYAVKKGENGALIEAIDLHLEELKKDRGSYYYESLERWLGILGKKGLPRWLKTSLALGGLVFFLLGGFAALLRRQVKSRTRHLAREMADHLRTQKALQASEHNYRELVESANVIILRLDPQGRVTFLNDFGESFFGFAKEELVGRTVVGTIVPDHASDGHDLAEMIRQLCARPEAFVINENENMRKNGERVWVSWRNRPVHDEEGLVMGLLCFGLDITERKRAEEARQFLDRAKDEFISTAAHELNTPLTTILGYAELLRSDLDHGNFGLAEKREFLDYIYAKGMVLERTVRDLLDISRIQQGMPLPLRRAEESLVAVARQAVEHYLRVKPLHHFRLEAPPLLPPLIFDADRIEQVLENLLNNAVKYSPPGSDVVVRLEEDGGGVRLSVIDQGIGMTPEQTARVFDKFYRADSTDTAVGGLGIGMSIVRQIVESHGGRIWLESAPGAGTRVSFTLPRSEAVEQVASMIMIQGEQV